MSANFTPNMGEYKPTGSFKFWCQKVLPLVYDDSLSYYETLCKVTNYLNNVIKNSDTLNENVRGLYDAYVQLQDYVNNYFDNVDFTNLVNEKLDTMASDGSLSALIQPLFDEYKVTIDNTENAQNNEINVLKSRMDTFTSLPDGSTTGDAELQDIRVDANGKVYHTAGDAVRGQVSELKSDLVHVNDELNMFPTKNGSVTFSGGLSSLETIFSNLNFKANKTYIITFVADSQAKTQIYSYLKDYSDSTIMHIDLNVGESNKTVSYTPKSDVYGALIQTHSSDANIGIKLTCKVECKDKTRLDNIEENLLKMDKIDSYFELSNLNQNKLLIGGIDYSTGEVIQSITTRVISEFVKVDKNTLYQIYTSNNNRYDVQYIFEYDENKKFLYYNDLTNETYHSGITTSEYTQFIRTYCMASTPSYTIPNVDSTTLFVEKGSEKSFLDKIEIPKLYIKSDHIYDYVPAYYKSHLEEKINTINGLYGDGNVLDSFIFMTDNHIDTSREVSIPIIKYIYDKTGVRFNVFGGDIITTMEKDVSISAITEFYRDCQKLNNFYPIIGNHEFNNPGGNIHERQLGKSLVSAITIDKFEDKFTSRNEFSYRVDNDKRKITYFFIGCDYAGNVTDSDIEWILSEFETLKDGYTVILLSHTSVEKANNLYFSGTLHYIMEGLNNLKNKGTYSYNSKSYDYSSKNVDVIGLIGGHTHRDYVYTYNNIVAIATTCQSYSGENGELVREKGTVTESAFDVVVIDKVEKKIHMIRIGAGEDRTIDYDSSSSTFGLLN